MMLSWFLTHTACKQAVAHEHSAGVARPEQREERGFPCAPTPFVSLRACHTRKRHSNAAAFQSMKPPDAQK